MPQTTRVHHAPPALVAVAAWLVPGAGHCLLGQRSRGLTIGITVICLFVLGLLIGGVRVVESPLVGSPTPETAGSSQETGSSDYWRMLMQRPWFIGQVLTGPTAIVAALIGKSAPYAPALGRMSGFAVSHSRLNEIGTLYTAVAGMLNLLAIIDATYRSSRSGDQQ